MGIVFHARHKNAQKTRRHQVERFMTKKVIAIAVCEVLSSFAMMRARLNLRLPCPNFPSIAFLILSSSKACFFFSLLTFAGDLPRGGPLILIPFSLHHARFSLVR
jgi:hypothetical protein